MGGFVSGLSNPSYSRLRSDPVPAFFDTAGYYYRARNRAAPNNLYLSADAIQRAENGSGAAAFAGPQKQSPTLAGGEPATSVRQRVGIGRGRHRLG